MRRSRAAVVALCIAACAGDDVAPPGRAPPRARDMLEVAGSGGALLLARRLVDAFVASHPGARVNVHPSIGSTGSVRALAEGAIDVGLLTRELVPAERALGVHAVPFARTSISLIAHRDVSATEVDARDLPVLFAGRGRWPSGLRAVPILREVGDASQEVLRREVPGLRAVIDRTWLENRYRVAYHDAQLVSAVASVAGSFGPLDEGQVACGALPVRVVRIRGMRDPAALRKTLALALTSHPPALARELVRFCTSARARIIVTSCGYQSP